MGRNTAVSTRPMPTRAPVISSIDLRVASLGLSPSSRMIRSTFSTTTMASSTSRPMARTMPNMVRVLMVKPAACSTAKAPSSTTGTAMVGIRVARQSCRKTNITTTTSRMASTRVLMTSEIEMRMKGVESIG